jgi:3-hydroxyacyl-CoA dehydrogenase
MFVFKAAVLGAGTMGGEIAQVIAAAGVPVVMKDVNEELVDAGLAKAREVTDGQLASLVRKEKLTQEEADARRDEILGRITGATEYQGFGDVDFVVEAVPERMEVKQAVFAELDEVTPGHAILASNTSALSISQIGSATTRPEQVVGFHFFWPASMMRLIEVVEGELTTEETAQAAANFAMQIRKNPIRCGEVPGFVVNRILISAASEIWRHQDETGRSPEDIDKEILEAKATPMGPFFLADMSGLDVSLDVAQHLREAYGDRFYVHSRMKELVEAGNLGQKTGRGYYGHTG